PKSAASAIVLSARTAFIVISSHWTAHGILDVPQSFATGVVMWITQYFADVYNSGRLDDSRMLLVFFILVDIIVAVCGR
ncbi:hypothetical protein CRG98_049333, partial [Punica granatum]